MSLAPVCKILRYRGRPDLAELLDRASMDLNESSTYGRYYNAFIATAEISAPIRECERLRALPGGDQQAILDAILEIHPGEDGGLDIQTVNYRIDPASLDEEIDSGAEAEVLQDIDSLRTLMIDVATGGPRIKDVDGEYRQRYKRVDDALRQLDFTNPNPYKDLWQWYGKWSSGDLPSYQSRREYIQGLLAPVEQRLNEPRRSRAAGLSAEPTGWPRVDRTLGEIRRQLEEARSEEQFQAVGLLCREALISLAQTVYDPTRHRTTDGIVPSETDAKRMLDAYLGVELAGGRSEVARKHAKASVDLANDLQHRRTATFREAALCAEATASAINITAILSGRRDPEGSPA